MIGSVESYDRDDIYELLSIRCDESKYFEELAARLLCRVGWTDVVQLF